MKGIVFNLLEEVVIKQHGEDTWDALLDTTGLSGSYTSLGSYPDGDMSQLVQAAARVLDISPSAVLLWFGRTAMPLLAERYRSFFEPHGSTRSFLLSLNSIIHPEVKKVYPGADVPVFDFQDAADGGLKMGYQSARKLCALAQGFAEGAADHFGETLDFQHTACMHHGDAKCQFHIRFLPKSPSL